MRPNEYSVKIIATVKAFREMRGLQQGEVAKKLNACDCNYSKFENGHKIVRLEDLKIIASALGVSMYLIAYIAEFYESCTVEQINWLQNFFKMASNQGETIVYKEDEFKILVSQIKKCVSDLQLKNITDLKP
jgi:transcriptional regulator with XRE-family HTH domain